MKPLLSTLALILTLSLSSHAQAPIAAALTHFTLEGKVSNASNYLWSVAGRPACTTASSVAFSHPTELTTDVNIIEPGSYLLRLTAYDVAGNVSWNDLSLTVGAVYQSTAPPTVSPISITITEIDPPLSSDTRAPYVKITGPATNSTISDTPVRVDVAASDNIGVMSAELVVNGSIVDSLGVTKGTLKPTFSLYWREFAISSGSYDLAVRVFDGAGNFTEQAIRLTK